MSHPSPLVRNVSDTARWVAAYRAMESERPDALFRDPYASRLMGERGAMIVKHMWRTLRMTWPFTMRTVAFDEFIEREIAEGCDMVVNLAAGLDARPYRMKLPPGLQWVEVDLPGIIDEKETILRDDRPVCRLERIKADLADATARRALFANLGARAGRALVLTEGLTIYLEESAVDALAEDLAAIPQFRRWVVDLTSPRLLAMLQHRRPGKTLADAGTPFSFAPKDGPEHFVRHGWNAIAVESMMANAAKHGRLHFPLNIIFRFVPNPGAWKANRPWSGVVLLDNTRAAAAP